MKIGLIAEDVCSLPEKIIRDFEIEIVKTKLDFRGFKTSAPSPGDYLKAYKNVLKKFEIALVITLSSKLSSCYYSALEAKNFFKESSKIFVFDSFQAAAGQGLLVLKAANLIKGGKGIEAILKTLEDLKKKIRLFCFLKTLYWIQKTGRVSKKIAAAFMILKNLGIYPYLGIKEGRVCFSGFNFWTRDEFEAIFNQLKHQAKKGKLKVGINYSDNLNLAFKLKEKLEKNLKAEVLFTSLVPPIVKAHIGSGTLISACYLDQ